MPDPSPPPRRPWWSILTGTRPGLEWFLLAVFPAIAAGAVAGQFFGALAGLGIGLAVLVVGILLSRHAGD